MVLSGNILRSRGIFFQKGGNRKGITIRFISNNHNLVIGARVDKGQRRRSTHALTPPAYTCRRDSTPEEDPCKVLACVGDGFLSLPLLWRPGTACGDMAYVHQGHMDNFLPLLLDKVIGCDNEQVSIALLQAAYIYP